MIKMGIENIKSDEILTKDEVGLHIRFEINNIGYEKGIKFSKNAIESKEKLKNLVKVYLETLNDMINKTIDEQYRE